MRRSTALCMMLATVKLPRRATTIDEVSFTLKSLRARFSFTVGDYRWHNSYGNIEYFFRHKSVWFPVSSMESSVWNGWKVLRCKAGRADNLAHQETNLDHITVFSGDDILHKFFLKQLFVVYVEWGLYCMLRAIVKGWWSLLQETISSTANSTAQYTSAEGAIESYPYLCKLNGPSARRTARGIVLQLFVSWND